MADRNGSRRQGEGYLMRRYERAVALNTRLVRVLQWLMQRMGITQTVAEIADMLEEGRFPPAPPLFDHFHTINMQLTTARAHEQMQQMQMQQQPGMQHRSRCTSADTTAGWHAASAADATSADTTAGWHAANAATRAGKTGNTNAAGSSQPGAAAADAAAAQAASAYPAASHAAAYAASSSHAAAYASAHAATYAAAMQPPMQPPMRPPMHPPPSSGPLPGNMKPPGYGKANEHGTPPAATPFKPAFRPRVNLPQPLPPAQKNMPQDNKARSQNCWKYVNFDSCRRPRQKKLCLKKRRLGGRIFEKQSHFDSCRRPRRLRPVDQSRRTANSRHWIELLVSTETTIF